MKKKIISILLIICILMDITLVSIVIIPKYQEYKEQKEYKRLIEQATVKIDLKDNLNTSFFSTVKVTDFIESINGQVVDDYKIDTSKLGSQKVSFEYINEENIKIPYSYDITIKDDIAPDVWLGNSKSVTTSYTGNLLDDIVCADNLDDTPKCEIIGNYDTKKVGSYKLKFIATDNSGNKTEKDFTLNVKEPTEKKSSSSSSSKRTNFSDVIAKHKTANTKIGIDVSTWQGNIDFQKVKDAGVEFVFIRVGSTYGINGEYFVDKQFVRNIKGFNEVGIPVGIYFYSYANSEESAIRDAKWVLNQIKGYKIDFPIAYDWESWSFYNEFNQSFYSLTKSAKAFLDTINEAGYDGVLYSSKNYLEKVWFDTGYEVWLAHYTEQTSYQGDYTYWQLCSNGKVDGISGRVDINIMYT